MLRRRRVVALVISSRALSNVGRRPLISCEAKDGPTPEPGGRLGTSAAVGGCAATPSATAAPKGGRSGGTATIGIPRVTGTDIVGAMSGAPGVGARGAETRVSSSPPGSVVAMLGRPADATAAAPCGGGGSGSNVRTVAIPTAAGIRRSTGNQLSRFGRQDTRAVKHDF
jgi:hypothetical protein